ncbi:MAG: hypothetical protein K0S24_3777 [Sphingobacterium sp.]|jgi:hypothetical protein|nr:hypothetical protein [Sphingobacterium sp.]
MSFAGVYPHYIQKAEKKGHTKEEVNEIIFWLTGYHTEDLQQLPVRISKLRINKVLLSHFLITR